MNKLYLILFLILFALTFFFTTVLQEKKEFPLELHNVIDCSIFDMQGYLIWQIPYMRCIFFEDGRVLAAASNDIKMFNENMEQIWSKKITTHHQANLTESGEILLLAERYREFEGKRVRFDALYVLNQSGEILKSFYLDEWLNIWNRQGMDELWEIEMQSRRHPDVHFEFSHFNSFYQIGKNELGKQNPVLEEGNYLVNDKYSNQLVILSQDLRKILWSMAHKKTKYGKHSGHDAQILSSGKILIYTNRADHPTKSDGPIVSALDEIDPVTGEQRHLFFATPPESFFSPYAGGVQILKNGNVLYSDITNGAWAYEVNPKENWKRVWSMKKKIPSNQEQSFQQIKRYDLTSFLKKNRGL